MTWMTENLHRRITCMYHGEAPLSYATFHKCIDCQSTFLITVPWPRDCTMLEEHTEGSHKLSSPDFVSQTCLGMIWMALCECTLLIVFLPGQGTVQDSRRTMFISPSTVGSRSPHSSSSTMLLSCWPEPSDTKHDTFLKRRPSPHLTPCGTRKDQQYTWFSTCIY